MSCVARIASDLLGVSSPPLAASKKPIPLRYPAACGGEVHSWRVFSREGSKAVFLPVAEQGLRLNQQTAIGGHPRGAYAMRRMLLHNGKNRCRQREFIIDASHLLLA